MKRFLWLLGLGLFVFVLSLVARFPADVAYRALADQMGDRLSVSSIEGTVFAGKATVVVENDLSFDSVAWRWQPMAALSGRLEFGTRWAIPAGELGARVGLEIGGDVVVSEIDGRLSLVRLLQSFDAKTGGFNGWLTPEIEALRFRDGELESMKGVLYVRNFVWQNGTSVQLGDVAAEFDNGALPWAFDLRDDGGPVRLSGNLTVEEGGAYQLGVALAPRNQNPELEQFFAIIGPGDSEGQRFLSYSGNLDEL